MLQIYKASAGSGKTYTLTREYLRMLLQDYHPVKDRHLPHSHILAVTFTKKATAEMKERILQSLAVLATTPEHSPYLADLQVGNEGDIHTIQQRAQALLVGILQDYTHFSVSTIDGFFQQVVRTFALELGLPATYDLSMDSEEIVEQAVDDLYRRVRSLADRKDATTAWLVAMSQENIEDDKGWNAKDTVGKFAYELLREQPMRQMSAVQAFFADKAALQTYQKQLKQICDRVEQEVSALQQQILAIVQGLEGLNTKVLSPLNKPVSQLVSKGIGATLPQLVRGETAIFTKTKTTKQQQVDLQALYEQQLHPLCQRFVDIFNGTVVQDYATATAILQKLYALGLLQDVAGQIAQTNRKIGRVPISDINMLIHRIIDGQDAPFIYERMGQYFRHFMIDEFQDTSNLQWTNFRPLIEESEASQRQNLLVGDVKQSIYRWRNSDWRLLEGVEREFRNTCLPAMKDNWRTAPVVVEENERLIVRYSRWVAETLKQTPEYADPQIADAIERIYAPVNVHQKARQHLPGVFQLQFFEGDGQCQEQCLSALPPLLEQLQDEGFALGDIALLVRTRTDASTVAHYLIDKGYRVQSADGLLVQSHSSVQLLTALLKAPYQPNDEVLQAKIRQLHPDFSDEERILTEQARRLPLYEQVQAMINALRLTEEEGALPYLTTFQDCVYQFTQNRVADVQAFLDYWERKSSKVAVPSPEASDAVRVMTIHSSKGLEFDVVILPLLTWEVMKFHTGEVLWCTPETAPFNQLPLVAVPCNSRLLDTHFKREYIDEVVSQYIDNLNLTYVAFTRPKYRLYAFGAKYSVNKSNKKLLNTVGQLLSFLYEQDLDTEGVYRRCAEGDIRPKARQEDARTGVRTAQYVSSPLGERLILRSRAEDDFATDTPLSTVHLGILMHEWLSMIGVWGDATPSLQKMQDAGTVTATQASAMQKQLHQLRTLLASEGHADWFEGKYKTVTERDILTPQGVIYRPDRVMTDGTRAIVIDYKFGSEHRRQYHEQVCDYIFLLQQMGYQVCGYLVYIALQRIIPIDIRN